MTFKRSTTGKHRAALPAELIFYVTACLGPKGQHYALAVASRRGEHGFSGMDVVKACVAIGRLLSSGANRAAVDGELSLAAGFYAANTSPYSGTPTAVVDRVYAGKRGLNHTSFVKESDEEGEHADARRPSWCRGRGERNWEKPIEFPFIAAGLMLALGHDAEEDSTLAPAAAGDVTLEPLGLTLDPDLGGFGMAVVDVSDLDCVRHGIVAYWSKLALGERCEPKYDFDFSDEDSFDEDDYFYEDGLDNDGIGYESLGGKTARETYSKVPLTAKEYCLKVGTPTSRGLGNDGEGKEALETWKPLSNSVLRYIWPKSYIGHDVTGYDNSKTKKKKTLEDKSQPTERSWRQMVQETSTVDQFWEDEMEMQLERQPLDVLRTELERRPSELGANASAGQPLALAYAGVERLNWVRFGKLSCEALCTALRQPGTQGIKTMAIAVELASGNDCAAFLGLLGELPNLQHVCFFWRAPRGRLMRITWSCCGCSPQGRGLRRCEKRLYLRAQWHAPERYVGTGVY